MAKKIYPDVKDLIEQDEEGTITLNDRDLQKIFYEDRYKLMTQKKDELTANVKRYLKCKSHYTLANNIQKITSLIVTSSLTVATIVFTSGLAVPFFLIPTASGLTLFSMGLTASIEKIIKSKKTHLRSKIDQINTLLAKIDVYIEKSREDGVISPEEITHFYKLIEDEEKKKITKKRVEKNIDLQPIIESIIQQELIKNGVSDSSPRH